LNGFEQQLLGQNNVASEAFAKTSIGACTHGGETLVRGDGPGVNRARGPLFPVELEQSGAGWWLKTKVIDALPISCDDAGRRIEVRQDTGIHAVTVEKALRLQFQEMRDISHALRRKRFRVPDAAAEGDDDDLILAARWGFGMKPPGKDPVGNGEAGESNELALRQLNHRCTPSPRVFGGLLADIVVLELRMTLNL
jgi:hypothetical protein